MQSTSDINRIIRFQELNNLLGGITKRTLLRWESSGKFPKRVKLGEKSVGWIYQDIVKWLEHKIT